MCHCPALREAQRVRWVTEEQRCRAGPVSSTFSTLPPNTHTTTHSFLLGLASTPCHLLQAVLGSAGPYGHLTASSSWRGVLILKCPVSQRLGICIPRRSLCWLYDRDLIHSIGWQERIGHLLILIFFSPGIRGIAFPTFKAVISLVLVFFCFWFCFLVFLFCFHMK